MNNSTKNYINIVFGVIFLILVIVTVVTSNIKDTEGPVIKYDKKAITYKKGDDEKILIDGVTATDVKDKDVTDTIIIDSIIPSNDGKKAIVVYAAKDKSNNITKVQRVVSYKGSDKDSDEDTILDGKPVIKLKQEKVTISKGSSFQPLNYVEKIVDDKDEDLSRSISIDGYYDVNTSGVYQLYYYVVDSDKNISDSKLLVLTVE
ncbi:immunoglobulin-like domain-containing protein [Intestinibacter sp.]